LNASNFRRCVSEFDEHLCFARDIAVHCFALVLCLLIVGVEFEMPSVLALFEFTKNWFGRGVFYFFVGVSTFNTYFVGIDFHCGLTLFGR
jgi:hypothetical protein